MRFVHTIKQSLRIFVAALLLIVLTGVAPASAVVNNPTPTAKISFTFDDGLASTITQAAPAMATYGMKGTAYLISDCVGKTTVPNTCAADGNKPYLSWAEATQLQDTYGWEIGSHTVDHPQLSTDMLTNAQLAAELTNSKAALNAHGFAATNFATPYGDYDNNVLAEIAKVYASHRGFADVDNNVWSYNDYLINNMQVQAGVTVAQVKTRIDQAIANNHWLVLTFHGISTNPSTVATDYEYKTSDLAQIAAYAKSKQDAALIKNVNVNQGLVTSDTNLLTNGDFANGINNGWITNAPANIVADSATHGAYPEATKSVAITGGTGNQYLFSPQVPVTSGENYMFKSFLNLTARTSGELGYYVDEYNASGSWISGKWIQAISATTAKAVNFTYTPSSTSVKKASLQVYTTANSGIQAYVDQFQMFSLTNTTPPPAATNNLLTNSTFDAGLTGGWTTDKASAFAADSTSHGSNTDIVNSLKLTATTTNAHLFAPKVNVKSTSTYTVNAYANLATRTSGELGFYIDEYNAAGQWVSGQYAYGKATTGATNITFSYVPTSAAVTKAQTQVILPANSGITGYLDTLQFLAPASETAPVTPTNLVANGTFDAGIASGWTTNDATNIKADAASNGSPSNVVNSVSLASGTANRHLFSPQIAADSTKSYSIVSYLDLKQLASGEVGYYVDEYDVNGNWVSGQYKVGINAVSKGDVTFTYTPSSATVKKASLQVIVTGNSGTQAYFDDVRWSQN